MYNPFKYSISKISFWFCLLSLLLYSSTTMAHNYPITQSVPSFIKVKKSFSANPVNKAQKEAILILPGFGDKRKRRKKQSAFFEQLDYDVFIADYQCRKFFDLTLDKFAAYYETNHLAEYEKVHVFAYILGSWVINEYINKNGRKNIFTIIYDRSPLQERAPRIVMDKIPLMGKLSKGKVLAEFSKMPYPTLLNDSIRIGIIVESKATRLVRWYKKTALSYGPLDWQPASLNQPFDDLFYTPLNHDQMYTRFDVIGVELIHFLEFGRFQNSARRVTFEWDYFEKWDEIIPKATYSP